jgi:hypothetical protein
VCERSRLEGEAEDAEVVVEAEDGGRPALRRRDGADAVREREREVGISLHEVPRARVELGVGVTDDQAPGLDRLLEKRPERERRVDSGVEAEARRRLGDDEVGREQDVAGLAQRRVVVADRRVRAVAAPEQRDEGARVGVDDPQTRSFGAPYK